MFLLPKLGFLILGFLARFLNIRLLFFAKKMSLEGIDFKLVQSKYDASIWIPFKSRFVFKLNPEQVWDQFLKHLGLSVEFQTGDKEFDDRIYMASDSLSLNKHIAADEDLKKLIVELSKLGFKQIVVDGNYFKIKFDKQHSYDNSYLSKGVNIFKAIQEIEKKWHGNFSDPFAWKYFLTECITWSIAAYGIICLLEFVETNENVYLEIGPIMKAATIYSIALCASLIFVVFYIFRGSSRGHRIILESALVLILGVPMSTIGLLSDLNIQLDQQKSILIELLIENKSTYVTRSRRRSTRTHYNLQLQQKTNYRHYQIPTNLEVSSELFDLASQGQYLLVEVSPGRFKFPWYKRMQVRPTSSVSSSK